MAASLIVVQHAEKESVPGDPGLTNLGRSQAKATALWLAANEAPAALYTSPMRRAVETAQVIASTLGLEVGIDERLRERMNWGGPGAQPLGTFLEEWRRASADREFVPASGDSSNAAARRFLTAIDELASRHPGEMVAIVAHGGITVDLLRTLLGDAELGAAAPTLIDDGIPSCALTRLVSIEGRWDVPIVAATNHLDPAEDQHQRREVAGTTGRVKSHARREFVPGRQLAAAFYDEVVGPAVVHIPHATALLGWGSDVLGYDTKRSTDHGWGPRLQVFVDSGDVERAAELVRRALPETVHGWPTHFGWDDIPARSWVEVSALEDWLMARLGLFPQDPVATLDWLLMPQQLILEITSGPVFHDEPGELGAVRARLEWYPDQVWLWLLACQWQRISQEEAFVGRTAEVGDELGSRLVAARLARDLMRLCFLLERRYAPYSKWLGTAFAALDAAGEVGPALEQAVSATDWDGREHALADAYRTVARRHNELGITEPVDPSVRPYHGRPFEVLHAERFVAACREQILDPDLQDLPPVGAIDQFVDSTDILSHPHRPRRLRALLERTT
jgi:broad specificity phosphatase PhoE